METRDGLEQISDSCFEDALRLIHALTGISIGANRKTMVQGRLRKRAAELRLACYEDYLRLVKQDPQEKVVFIDLVTTNETYFFRTPRIWSYIQDVWLPKWAGRNPGGTFRAWSAAASVGAEAYSLGVLLEAFREKHKGFSYQILGTDISREMVQLCNEGSYKGRVIEAFTATRPEWFQKYMVPAGEGAGAFRVIPEIRSRVNFQEHNLFKPLVSGLVFDLVLVRNVLIYFKGPDQEKVLSLIEPRLAPGAPLIIGESESLSHIQTKYRQILPLIYCRQSANSSGEPAA